MFDELDALSFLEVKMILVYHSKESYLVGGAVRDLLLGNSPKDLDFVTDIPYKELTAIFEEAGWATKATGEAFLVLNVSKNGNHYEIANFRKDVNEDGRHCDVVVGTIEEDCKRRDFTINSLYLKLDSGIIIDPCSTGIKDIEERVIRFNGDPKKRIEEDYLRVFRFYRFITKGFTPDKKHLKVVRTMFNTAYKNTNPERVREEIEKMVDINKIQRKGML